MAKAHEVDYKIYGDDMQFVEIELDGQESVLAEAGAMMYMDEKIKMETIFGDGSGKDKGKGLMGKLMGAGKRVITGEGLFMTTFTNEQGGKAHVAFGAPYPGSIMAVDLNEPLSRPDRDPSGVNGFRRNGHASLLYRSLPCFPDR